MPVPDRYCSAFSPSTLKTIETHGARFRVTDALFFRTAYTANVAENERRTFQPLIVLDATRVLQWRCGCQAAMRPNDLCRHMAAVMASLAADDGQMPSERFDASVWRAIAFASFSDGRSIEANVSDPREQWLRKCVLTDQERELLRRGSGSTRLQFEASPWYRWSKEMFLRANDDDASVELLDGQFVLWADHGQSCVSLPPAAVEQIVTSAPQMLRAGGFEIAPQTLTPSLRIEITRSRALKFSPVLLGSGGAIHDRAQLPAFGKFFLIGERLASAIPAPPLFAERAGSGQSLLFAVRPSAGVPFDRETVIDEEDVFAFVDKHRQELAAMPESLAPEPVRNAQPVRLDGEVIFDFVSCGAAAASAAEDHHVDGRSGRRSTGLLEMEMTFAAGDDWVSAADIAKARGDGVRALIRGRLWIDVTDSQFAWLDGATIGPRGHILVTRLELLRIRGSLRGQAVFRGDRACERVFRLFDEIHAQSDAPSTASLGLDLYAYQQTGYQWLWLLQQNGFGGLLCDDMGLGKTHQAIALIAAMTHRASGQSAVGSRQEEASVSDGGGGPSRRLPTADCPLNILVVCPTSLLDHWRDKLSRYVPDAPVTLTTYGLVRSRIEQFRGKRFDLVVLDEMQTIKNADTATHHALRAIEKRIAIGLTGTPIENHEGELTALLDFVVPGYLPKHVDDRAMLRRLVRPFVLRRTKTQVLTELPPKIVDKRMCELTTEQRALYRRVMESRAKPLRAQLRAGGSVSYVHIFAALNYLKQICNHPASAGGGFGADVPSGKWEMFVELLGECMSSGLKAVVFSQYLPMLDLIEKHLLVNDIGHASIRGGTRARGEEIARFRDDPECRVFTASLRAGGLGIDLTSASVVIHYDRWWNQAREDQATDRVHRLGQSKGVQVIKLITRGTIEEKIDELIARKAALASDLIRADDPSLIKQFTRDELVQLLQD